MTYVSFIATSRNDNHGGNLLERMQVFVNAFLEQCFRHALDAELVLVEWNPPEDKPRLAKAIDWSRAKSCAIRIIEVPAKVHNTLKHSSELPLFQMIAKNVGIRRCKGEFALATNIDILFSDEIMHFLASKRLKKNCMYRVDRYDVPMPAGNTTEEQLEFCRNHILRISERDNIRNLITGSQHPIYSKLSISGHIKEWMQDLGLVPVTGHKRLHTAACGDFTLLSRDRWFRLRGYAELEMYSLHIDSLLCHAAHQSGASEIVLRDPMRIYHMEHQAGSGWTPEAEQKLGDRLAQKSIPQLPHAQFAEWALQMRRDRKPILFNPENWGFADLHFEETVMNG